MPYTTKNKIGIAMYTLPVIICMSFIWYVTTETVGWWLLPLIILFVVACMGYYQLMIQLLREKD